MIYAQLEEKILDRTLDIDQHEDIPTRKAWEVIAMLRGRKGFSPWWGSCDDESQNEMFDKVREIIRKFP